MQNIFIELLPPWVETGIQPAFYDKESGTVLQQVSRMYPKINQLIGSVNNQNTTIADYIQKFIDLKDYVETYLNNLDVQAEINNKLDQMSANGQLADIIAQYLQAQAVFGFDTIAEMGASENLVNGSICKVLGKTNYQTGDGGFYRIRTITSDDVVDGVNIVAITHDNTLIAELITNYTFDKLEEYVDINATQIYNTVADMQQSTKLYENSTVKTLGFHALNDGGGSFYKIISKNSLVPNGYDLLSVSDENLIAKLIVTFPINILSLGADKTGTNDNIALINFVNEKYKHNTIYFPSGKYLVSNTINIKGGNEYQICYDLEWDSEIFTSTSLDKLLSIGIGGTSWSAYDPYAHTVIKGGLWNGENCNKTIYISADTKGVELDNIVINNVGAGCYGIYVDKRTSSLTSNDSSDVRGNNLYINGKGSEIDNVGLYIEGQDNKWNDLFIRKCKTCIKYHGGGDYFTTVHGLGSWTNSTPSVSEFENTVFFYHLGGDVTITNAYADTFGTDYVLNTGVFNLDKAYSYQWINPAGSTKTFFDMRTRCSLNCTNAVLHSGSDSIIGLKTSLTRRDRRSWYFTNLGLAFDQSKMPENDALLLISNSSTNGTELTAKYSPINRNSWYKLGIVDNPSILSISNGSVWNTIVNVSNEDMEVISSKSFLQAGKHTLGLIVKNSVTYLAVKEDYADPQLSLFIDKVITGTSDFYKLGVPVNNRLVVPDSVTKQVTF